MQQKDDAVQQASRRAFLRFKSPRSVDPSIRPPWSVAEDQFIAECSRCDQCINVCSTQILNRGDGGFPEIDFNQGECTFCGKCAESCETDSFMTQSRTIENAWDLDVTINSSCLSLKGIVCRTCGDHCDSRAIHFRLQTGAVAAPEIHLSNCTGCGACLHACPIDAVSIKNTIRERIVA